MLKQLVSLVGVLWVFAFYSGPPLSSVSDPPVTSKPVPSATLSAGAADNTPTQPVTSTDNSATPSASAADNATTQPVTPTDSTLDNSGTQPTASYDSSGAPSPTASDNPETQLPNSYDNSFNEFTRLEVSISRRQVTLYQGTLQIKTYPIAVGSGDWETPTGNFKVIQMLQNPTWIHPLTGKVVPNSNPQNPLGHYWIGFWTNGKNWVGFHGTPDPNSIGKPASHGCIRMYNDDIEELFYQVSIGTPVTVVD